jgi:hypothetical protein
MEEEATLIAFQATIDGKNVQSVVRLTFGHKAVHEKDLHNE